MRLNIQTVELAMANRGFNKTDLANALDVTRQTVYWYFSGNPIKPKMAKKFSDALGVPVNDLVESEVEARA